ncbi:MAG: ATPase, T2SS/T4P/T4SS family [Candidatus Omnitrophota bacterium]
MAVKIEDILVKKKIIAQEQLDKALEEQKKKGGFLGDILVNMGFVDEEEFLKVLSEHLKIDYVKLRKIEIAEEVIKKVPPKFAWHYHIMPVRFSDNTLTIAVFNPMDVLPIDDIEINLGYRVEKILAAKEDILWAIRKYYGVGAETIEELLGQADLEEKPVYLREKKVEDIERLAQDVSVIKLVNQILEEAIKDRATDLHIEPFRDGIILRSRVDGILYETSVSEDIKFLYHSIVSRIKIMAGLDIVERRLPQDGRGRVNVGVNEYDLRISILPSLYGEDVVIRILPTAMLFNLEALGFTSENYKIIDELLKKPYGIIFITGPTGSGKTTTLYACLSRLNNTRRKIITIEDPVEYELKKVNQIQVNPKIKLTFATALRSMLRHDPDVLMVGEVRDSETAQITIQASLTGHLVFSSLHTNDAAGAATRLIDMGIEPYLIVSSVEAFVAQRLIRLICPSCKTENKENKLQAPIINGPLYYGKGCEVCKHSGYKGRTAIYEVLLLTESIKELIMKKVSADEIKRKAISLGMKTLKEDGLDKVAKGLTTLDEVMRVIQLET